MKLYGLALEIYLTPQCAQKNTFTKELFPQ